MSQEMDALYQLAVREAAQKVLWDLVGRTYFSPLTDNPSEVQFRLWEAAVRVGAVNVLQIAEKASGWYVRNGAKVSLMPMSEWLSLFESWKAENLS